MEQSSDSNHQNEQVNRLTTAYLPVDGNKSELYELETRLRRSLDKCRIKDVIHISERMERTEERIKQYEDEDRKDDAEKERRYLNELKQLQNLRENISVKYAALLSMEIKQMELSKLEDRLRHVLEKCKIKDIAQLSERLRRTEQRIEQYEEEERQDAAEQEIGYLRELEQLERIVEEIILRRSTGSPSENEPVGFEATRRIYLENLRTDLARVPCCAERTTMELLGYFQRKWSGEDTDEKTSEFFTNNFRQLQEQIEREQLYSQQIRTSLQDLNRFVHNEDWPSSVRVLNRILAEIRPLYVQEIERLIKKSRNASKLITNQEIVLLVGTTGSGKSTTIQFLAGAKMKNTGVEIAPGKFLEHIAIDGPIRNASLKSITSSPLSKSETRCIALVTVPLRDVLGSHHTGEIILCDAPGFEDTAGPEVDIANSIGVIEAIKTCSSVKILALSSCTSVGDRGDGIEKLARILIQMIDRIEERLDAISYAFTKYSPTTDVNAIITSFRNSRVEQSSVLRSDSTFVAVLDDMIAKTKKNSSKIDPVKDNPKTLIEILKSSTGIRYPSEVFRFSITQNTQNALLTHAHRCQSGISCAMKYRDINLVLYYMNSLKFLSDLIKENTVRDAYDKSIDLLSNDIEQYCTKIVENFDRYLISQDGLKDEDIREYQLAHAYIQQIQILKEHLGSKLVSTDFLIEKVLSALEKRGVALQEEKLDSSAVGIFLGNFRRLQDTMKELQASYRKTCQEFEERFQSTLVESIPTFISSNEFKQVGERLSTISKCSPILSDHLNGKVEEAHRDIIKQILEHLNRCSGSANKVLCKNILNEKDIEDLHQYIVLLKSVTTDISIQATQSLDKVYDEFIHQIVQQFDRIDARIKEIWDKNGIHGLESIELLVIEMERIRTLPEMEVKTARTFHHTIENVRGYMQQLQRESEKLFHSLDHSSGVVNYRPFAQFLVRLKRTAWIDRIIPGTSDCLMRSLREDLAERAEQLENRLKKLDLSLKYPQNVHSAKELLEKFDAMKILEASIPELKDYRDRSNQYLFDTMKKVFDSIQKTFDLTEKTIDPLKHELNQLEQIKRACDQLFPARIFLRKSGYPNIDVLNQRIEFTAAEAEKRRRESQLNEHSSPTQYTRRSSQSKGEQGVFDRLLEIKKRIQRSLSWQHEDPEDDTIAHTTTQIQDDHEQFSLSIEKQLQRIKEEYNTLLTAENPDYPSETDFLRKKGQTSYELLEKTIDERSETLTEYKQCGQIHYFSDQLDASLAENALIYINNSDIVGHRDIQEMAEITMDNVLRKYLEAYSDFLGKEMKRNFDHITRSDESHRDQYSASFEKYFEQLISFKQYPLVFSILHSAEKIDHWHRNLLNYHRVLESDIEKCQNSGKNQELQNLLSIAQALTCVERFCTIKVGEFGFRTLDRQYKAEITQSSREAQNRVKESIVKGDFAMADSTLSEVIETLADRRLTKQIKHELDSTLKKMIQETKRRANWLNGKLGQQEDYRNTFQEIDETVEKVRTVLRRNHLMELLEESTKSLLLKFESELNQILLNVLLHELQNIEMFIDGNHFLEAEQSMKNVLHAQQELAGCYKSKTVETKTTEIRKRLSTLPNDIIERYNFSDLNNYAQNPPKDILVQFTRAILGGFPRYTQASSSFREKIRVNFTKLIERVRENPSDDQSRRIRSIKEAFHCLPDDFKSLFQWKIDELNQLRRDTNAPLEFD